MWAESAGRADQAWPRPGLPSSFPIASAAPVCTPVHIWTGPAQGHASHTLPEAWLPASSLGVCARELRSPAWLFSPPGPGAGISGPAACCHGLPGPPHWGCRHPLLRTLGSSLCVCLALVPNVLFLHVATLLSYDPSYFLTNYTCRALTQIRKRLRDWGWDLAQRTVPWRVPSPPFPARLQRSEVAESPHGSDRGLLPAQSLADLLMALPSWTLCLAESGRTSEALGP